MSGSASFLLPPKGFTRPRTDQLSHRDRLVLSTLQPLVQTAPSRPCYRLIGGTLVQRTVKDVVPQLETNYSGIKDVLEGLVRTYKTKEDEFGSFQREYGIQVRPVSPRAFR